MNERCSRSFQTAGRQRVCRGNRDREKALFLLYIHVSFSLSTFIFPLTGPCTSYPGMEKPNKPDSETLHTVIKQYPSDGKKNATVEALKVNSVYSAKSALDKRCTDRIVWNPIYLIKWNKRVAVFDRFDGQLCNYHTPKHSRICNQIMGRISSS